MPERRRSGPCRAHGGRARAAFGAVQGIQLGSAARRSIGSLTAETAPFQAQTSQGRLAGTGAWIDYAGHTFQILGYAPGQAAAGYAAALDQSIATFAPLTDPALLAVQPRRVRVLTTDRAMTLADVNTRWPSTIPLDELAIINQVASPSTPIPARTAVKRVVGAGAPGQ